MTLPRIPALPSVAMARVELFCSQVACERVSAVAAEGMRTAAAMLAVNSNLRMTGRLLKRVKTRFHELQTEYIWIRSRKEKYT